MNSPSPYLSYAIGTNEQRFYFDLRDKVRIGRGDPSSGLVMDLALPHSIPGVGRHHATIHREGTAWFVVDGSKDGPSKNGTYLNGVRIQAPALIEDGSQLLLGTFPLEFCLPRASQSGESDSLKQIVDTPALAEIAPEISISMADLTVSRPAASGGSSIWRINFDSDSSLRSGSNQTTRSLSLFSELGKALQTSQAVDEFLENIVNTLLMHVQAESVSVVGWIPERNEFPPLTTRNDNLQAERRGVSRTLLNKAIKRREAMLVIDPGADPNLGISNSITDVTSFIVAPLWQDQHIRGALYVDTKKGIQAFGQRELEVVSGIALFTAVGIDLFEQ
ncbi:MAG: FHA domain-containing protein, partial [Planctomycetaceae bacterium]